MEKSDHKRYVWRNADKRDLYGEMQTYEMCATMGKASAGKKGGFRNHLSVAGSQPSCPEVTREMPASVSFPLFDAPVSTECIHKQPHSEGEIL